MPEAAVETPAVDSPIGPSGGVSREPDVRSRRDAFLSPDLGKGDKAISEKLNAFVGNDNQSDEDRQAMNDRRTAARKQREQAQSTEERLKKARDAKPTPPADAPATPPIKAETPNVESEVPTVTDPVPTTDEESDPAAAEKPNPQPLSDVPPHLVRAGKASGMTDEEIAELYQADPVLATRTLSHFHRANVELSNRFAQLGKQQLAPQQPPTQQHAPLDGRQHAPTQQFQQNQPQQQLPQSGNDILAEIYGGGERIKAINDKWGEGAVQEIIGPVAPVLNHLIEVAHAWQAERDQRETERREQLNQKTHSEVTQFFKNIEPEFHEQYGNGTGAQSESQRKSRGELFKLAGEIMAGHKIATGNSMTVADALQAAVYQHSAPNIAALERKRLLTKVQKRSQQTSLRPTQRTGWRDGKSLDSAGDAYDQVAARIGLSER